MSIQAASRPYSFCTLVNIYSTLNQKSCCFAHSTVIVGVTDGLPNQPVGQFTATAGDTPSSRPSQQSKHGIDAMAATFFVARPRVATVISQEVTAWFPSGFRRGVPSGSRGASTLASGRRKSP